MNRRNFLTGMAGILATTQAPALVSAGNIMRIKPVLQSSPYVTLPCRNCWRYDCYGKCALQKLGTFQVGDVKLDTIQLAPGTFRIDNSADFLQQLGVNYDVIYATDIYGNPLPAAFRQAQLRTKK